MFSHRKTATALLAAIAVAALGACASTAPKSDSSGASGGSGKTFVIGYSQSNNAEPYRAQLNAQLAYYVKKYPDLKLLPITDAHQDSATQVSQVQNFVQQKVDVLIVSPNEPAPLTAAVLQACQAHIPVIILDRSVNTDCYTAFIGGDNYAIGKLAGQAAVAALPSGGNVAELQGILSDQPQIDRDKGFRDAIAGHDITIAYHQEAKWLKANATTIMQQWLSQGTKIDLVYGENDDMALGAVLAAQGANKASQIKFIGTDGLAIPTGGIRAVQQGSMYTTFVYPTGAEQAAATAEAIVHGQSVAKKQTLPTIQITKDNADAVYKQYDMTTKS
ncbi:substrate-binding domain-containing protein [Catenulispora sp. NF23]|uniref:Substrate-binding domain-containing protein n=1 Tax=Catenulispora pinistramenti TaxID=2705254 RepID=A0ABS5KV62_9ACTN|nr:substrate-binding domain-containing protein [Catenulispora pinistramenti]MBS2539504.1 substrate-binding domain-containing protein [Catenulispora pinistramenti]MBS2549943.1 substrate-binding domain-containing protein [Catenulispora pinistramenti]